MNRVSQEEIFTVEPNFNIKESIFEVLLKIVEICPENIAIADNELHISYSILLVKVRNYAFYLQKFLDDTKNPVAICIPYSHRYIVSMLALNSLGRPFLPLDINTPALRNREIIKAAEIQDLISTLDFSENHELNVINIEELNTCDEGNNFQTSSIKEDLAYIIYTSGSTGKPKGVYQNQENLLFDAMQFKQSYFLNENDRIISVHAPVGVVGIRENYSSIISGSSLYLTDIKKEGVSTIGDFIRTNQISVFRLVPGVFRAFLALETKPLSTIRIIGLGGERIYRSDFELFKVFFAEPALLLISIGSTEVATTYSYRCLTHSSLISTELLPLGYPVHGRPYTLINSDHQVVNTGEEGEVEVRSKYLTLGYWKDPELTALHYTYHADGTRSFRTGDTGYVLPDGNFYFLGRNDNQIKFNGNRVEPDEVNEKIRILSGIRNSYVLARTKQETSSLSAFVELTDNSMTESDIRTMLKKVLPKYMIPSTIRILDSIPLLSSFKIDVKKLSEIEITDDSMKPDSQGAGLLKTLWLVYTSDRSGFDNNRSFSECGGSSIDIVYLAADLEKELKIKVPAAYINSSIKPSVLSVLISVSRLTEKHKYQDFNSLLNSSVYLFQPATGLTGSQVELVKEMLSEFPNTTIIKYPINGQSHYNDLLIDNCANRIIESNFSDVLPGKFIFFGICNGNNLAQVVASKLKKGKKPLFQVNIDTDYLPKNRLYHKSDKSSINVLLEKLTQKGLLKTLGYLLINRINPPGKINAVLWYDIMLTISKIFRLPFSAVYLRIFNLSANLKNAGIPLFLFSSELLTSVKFDNSCGWADYYKSVKLIDTPYSHQNILKEKDSHQLIMTYIKELLLQEELV